MADLAAYDAAAQERAPDAALAAPITEGQTGGVKSTASLSATVLFSLAVGADVDQRTVLVDMGGTSKGVSVYLHDGAIRVHSSSAGDGFTLAAVETGRAYHVQVVYDRALGTLRARLDGVVVDDIPVSGDAAGSNASAWGRIDGGQFANHLNSPDTFGPIDGRGVTITRGYSWTRALDAADLDALHEAYAGAPDTTAPAPPTGLSITITDN